MVVAWHRWTMIELCAFPSFEFESSRNFLALYIPSRFIAVVRLCSRLERIYQGKQLEETPAMTKKSTEREISIKGSLSEAGATVRGNVELPTDAKL